VAVAVAEKLALPETLGDLDKLEETLGLLEATTDPVFEPEKLLDNELLVVNVLFGLLDGDLLVNELTVFDILLIAVVDNPIGSIFRLYVV
jgi:hypothetical protein